MPDRHRVNISIFRNICWFVVIFRYSAGKAPGVRVRHLIFGFIASLRNVTYFWWPLEQHEQIWPWNWFKGWSECLSLRFVSRKDRNRKFGQTVWNHDVDKHSSFHCQRVEFTLQNVMLFWMLWKYALALFCCVIITMMMVEGGGREDAVLFGSQRLIVDMLTSRSVNHGWHANFKVSDS